MYGSAPSIRTRSQVRFDALLALLLWSAGAVAQVPLSDLIFTVGTTGRDTGGNDWSYLLIDTPSTELLAGKQFAVFGKQGDPASANTFTRRGTMAQQSDPGAITALLNQSVSLGQNLTTLSNALNLLLRSVPGISNQPLVTKVVIAFQTAQSSPQTALYLDMLAKSNPGLSLCMGRAFAEPINTITTYELREVHPLSGAVGDVIGRTTITPGSPILLPAPARPFPLTATQPSDDLIVRLRWGTPDDLRRLSLAGYGFNIWRMGYTQAVAGNFHKFAPTLAQLYSNPGFVRINESPVQATLLTDAAAQNESDTRTYFFADDNGRSRGFPPFTDGERQVYFVTARDVLGRDGLVSRPGVAQICRRKAPLAPVGLAVRDEALTDVASNVVQRFRVSWQQNANANDPATHYWLYRWPNPSMAFTNDLAPLSNRIAVLQHVAGTSINSLLDTNANSPTAPGPSVYWYTVRSVYEGACGPVLSPHSEPASGVLRERAGPDAPTGGVLGSCGTPAVMFSNFARVPDVFDPSRWHYRFSCERRDRAIAWVQFFATNASGGVETIGPTYFEANETRLEADYWLPVLHGEVTAVGCVVGTVSDRVSRVASYRITTSNEQEKRAEVSFFAGTVLMTAAESSDPLIERPNCGIASNVQIDPSGTVTMQFFFSTQPLLVQASTNGVNWFDVGTAYPEGNSTQFSISYPACLTGPIPQFRACGIYLPTEGECIEHLARAADNGPVAPVIAYFSPTQRTREYRVYRQVDGGDMTLISQGRTTYNPLRAARRIVVKDDVMPPVTTRLCYFAQVFDENGNPSPMASLGCRESPPPALPQPVLAEPAPAGTIAQPQVTLNWFCPTAGVHRFRFLIKRVDKKPEPSPGSPSAVGFVSSVLKLSQPSRHTSSFIRARMRRSVSSVVSVKVDEGQLTPTLNSGFGPGPQFTLTANVLPNATYQITVQALNSRDGEGPVSEMWEFTWRPPPVVNNVSWPARPLPPVRDFDDAPASPPLPYGPRVAAVLFTNAFGYLADYEYPVGIRIGEIDRDLRPEPNIGTNTFVLWYGSPYQPGLGAHDGVFRRLSADASRVGDFLLPIVVYRQQVTNAAFSRVSDDLVQVTPMIEQIPSTFCFLCDIDVREIPDRLIAVRYEDFGNDPHWLMYLRDQQPVLKDARYRYFVARFQSNGEVAEIIPAGEVEINYFIPFPCIDCE